MMVLMQRLSSSFPLAITVNETDTKNTLKSKTAQPNPTQWTAAR